MRYVFGAYELDTDACELRQTGVPVALTLKIYHVLAYLIEHHERVVLKDELLEHVWPDTYVDDSAVKHSIMLARRAIGDKSHASQAIKTLRGKGYRFIAPVTVHDHASPRRSIPAFGPSPQAPADVSGEPLEGERSPDAFPQSDAQRYSALQRCAACQHDNHATAQYCVACGTQLRMHCRHCAQAVPLPATYCPACGQRLAAGDASAAAQPAATSPAATLPQALMPHASTGERKLVTALCCTVINAPIVVEGPQLDAIHSLMQAVYALASTEVRQYGGTIQPVTGEGFLVLFGAPVAQEDHAQRAVRAALGIQRRLGEEHARLRLPSGETLTVSLALHTGLVVIGQLGGDAHRTAMVVGDAMTLASALARHAAPGTLVASAATLRLVHGEVRTASLPPLHVEAHATPVPVARILELVPPQPTRAGTPARPHHPLVGREADLAVLYARLALAERGQGQVVGIVGEPGMGKSRLLYEFRQTVQARAVTYAQGHCHSYGSTTPYVPVLDLLRALWGLSAADSPATLSTKVQAGLQEAGLTPDTWAPMLLPLLSLETDLAVHGQGLSSELRERTFEALHQVFLQSSRRQPCILEVDNVHWIDATSEAYLTALIERLAGAPLLLLLTFRTGYQPTWLAKSYATQMALQPLGLDDSRQVVQAAVRHSPLPATVEQQLLTKAAGNPFFLEELAQTVVEQEGHQVALRVPDTIQAVLAERLDRLPPDEKQLIQVAAVIGTEVPLPLLHALTAWPEDTLRQSLTRLQAAEFLYETRLVPERLYTFKHVLTHEVAYNTLLQEQRRMLHRRIVEGLETLYADRLTEQVDWLAHHALRGEMWETACDALWQAGKRAFVRSAYREAVACFEQALHALQQLPQGRETSERAIDLRLDLRDALLPLGENERSLAILHDAERLAESLDDARRIGWLSCYISTHCFALGDHDRALKAGQRALALATACEDVTLQVSSHLRLVQAYHALGDYRRAVDLLTWNIASLEKHFLPEYARFASLPALHSHAWLAWCLTELGDFSAGIAHGTEALRMAEATETDRSYHMLVASSGLGMLYLRKGDLHQAIPLFERSWDLCQRAQVRFMLPIIAAALGATYAYAGRLAEALPLLEQAVAQGTSTRIMFYHPLVIAFLSEAYLLAGRIHDAHALGQRALDLCQVHHERGHQAWALRLLGEIHRHREPPDASAAEHSYLQALSLADTLGMRPLAAQCHFGLGVLYGQIQQEPAAHQALSTAITGFRSMDMTFWRQQAEATLAQMVR